MAVGLNNLNTTFSGVISDTGSLIKTGEGTLTLSGTNTYSGTTRVNDGKLLVNGSTASGVTVDTFGIVGGTGTVPSVSVDDGGTLAPGAGVGILNISGDMTLTSGTTFHVELDGTTVGTQYSQARVGGLTTLTGSTLSLQLGFTPAIGDQFTILALAGTSGNRVGVFNGLPTNGATLVAGGRDFSISYFSGDGNDIVLTVVGTAILAGDFNHDGVVNLADYVVWRKGLGTTYTQGDYGMWRGHFGATAAVGTSLTTGSQTPEPDCLVLLAIMLAAIGCDRRMLQTLAATLR